MRHPFRRFSFTLAEKLGMTISQLYSTVDSHELSEWMAFYLTKDEKWQDKYTHSLELEMSRNQDEEKRMEAIRRMIGGHRPKAKDGNNIKTSS